VNCEERLHICKAACCQLDFALSVEEVESGKVKWDLGRPYFIRQDATSCHYSHLNPSTQQSNIITAVLLLIKNTAVSMMIASGKTSKKWN
jgi:hypothetical protein